MSADLQESSTLTVRLEEELLRRFKIVCIRKGKSMSGVLREFLEWYVKNEEGKI